MRNGGISAVEAVGGLVLMASLFLIVILAACSKHGAQKDIVDRYMLDQQLADQARVRSCKSRSRLGSTPGTSRKLRPCGVARAAGRLKGTQKWSGLSTVSIVAEPAPPNCHAHDPRLARPAL